MDVRPNVHGENEEEEEGVEDRHDIRRIALPQLRIDIDPAVEHEHHQRLRDDVRKGQPEQFWTLRLRVLFVYEFKDDAVATNDDGIMSQVKANHLD